jgi:integrase
LLAGLQWESEEPGNVSRITDDEAVIDRPYVKTGVEIRLPLFPLTRDLLAVAKAWAAHEGYRGTQVFYPGLQVGSRNASKLPHYSIQSYTNALHAAERRAGITPIPYRAGHGFRRGLVGDLTELTGDVHGALQAINDRDPRMASHYRVRRDDSVQKLLERRIGSLDSLPDSLKCATNVQPNPENAETAEVGGFASTSL